MTGMPATAVWRDGSKPVDDDLRAWFDREGLMRYALEGGEHGEIAEVVAPPVVYMGPGDDDVVLAPHPEANRYRAVPLGEMTVDDFNNFMFRWFEAAVARGDIRCANCGKPIAAGEDLPDPETWDALFVEKELVAWMLVHFDCKKWLAKRLKGRTPFDLTPGAPPDYDLSTYEREHREQRAAEESENHAAE